MDEKKCCCCEQNSENIENEGGCCSSKTTKRDEQELTRLVNRLSRIEGQIRGIKKMLESDAYCADILTQSSAAASALNSFNKDLLSCHIHHCVVRDIKLGKVEVVDELMDIVQKLMK